MSIFDFDVSIDRQNTASIKWDLYQGKDIIPLWVADMDFRSPPAVIEALQQRVEHGVFGYTHPPQELVETIVTRLFRAYGWKIEPGWIIWLPGLVSGLNVACRATGKIGCDVLTTVPIYPPFLTAPQLSRRNLITVPLIENKDRWVFDFDLLERLTSSRTGLFMLCNPHNPTGRVFTRQELEDLTAICMRHKIPICSDEIHCELVLDHDKKHIPLATLGQEVAESTITLMAPSKTFNIPGLCCSFAIVSNKKLRSRFKKVMAGIVPEINALGFTATLAAYRDSDDWHQALLSYLRKNRDLVEKTMAANPGLTMRHAEATYLAWLDASSLSLADPADFFEAAGVALSSGRDFGAANFLRLNFGCSSQLLKKALQRMTRALDKYQPPPTKGYD